MDKIYFNPENPASFGSVKELQLASGESLKTVKSWLKQQNAYTLHKTVKRKFTRRKVIVGGIDHQWQCDLIDVGSFKNKNIKFLLTVIDVFSKYAWVVPVKNKTNKIMVQAFASILNKSKRKPFKLQSDDGTEFKGKMFQDFLGENHIDWFASKNMDTKATVVERFNRTIMAKLSKYMTHKGTKNFLNVLPSFVKSYNGKVHSSTGIAPKGVNSQNAEYIWQKLYEDGPVNERRVKQKQRENPIPLHTPVRLVKNKQTFKKSYLQGWTDEVFHIIQVINTQPFTYRVGDFQGEIIDGSFYSNELQEVDPQLYFVEKILKTRTKGRIKQNLVKWKGYPDSANTWIEAKTIVDL